MIAGTDFVHEDDPCVNLGERNIMAPDNRGVHRYEILLIVRNHMPYEYRRDMGTEEDWKGVQELRIIGGTIDPLEADETVGSMREMARDIREKPAFDLVEVVQDGLWKELKSRPDRIYYS